MSAASAREQAIVALEGVRLPRMLGRPTLKTVNKMRKAIAAEYAKAKTTHPDFPLGEKFGFSAAVLKTHNYISKHNAHAANVPAAIGLGPAWTFQHPTRPDIIDNTILAAHSDHSRDRKKTIRAALIKEFDRFDGYETAFTEKLEKAVEEAYFETIKDDTFAFDGLSVNDMLNHLESQCLALTGREKAKKLNSINLPWDKNDAITTFFNKVSKLEKELLDDYGIVWSDSMKVTLAVDEMYSSNIFTADDMMDWEDQDEHLKTWPAVQTYFTPIWKKRKRYTEGPAPAALGYESAANVVEGAQNLEPIDILTASDLKVVADAATWDKEHIQQMSAINEGTLQAVKRMQDQMEKLQMRMDEKDKTIASLIAQNAKLIELLAKGGGSPRNRGNRGKGPKEDSEQGEDAPRREHKPNCKICFRGLHKTENCPELESNASKRPDGWKSVLKAGALARE